MQRLEPKATLLFGYGIIGSLITGVFAVMGGVSDWITFGLRSLIPTDTTHRSAVFLLVLLLLVALFDLVAFAIVLAGIGTFLHRIRRR